MRGHALGPFDKLSNLEVQNVMVLTPAAPIQQVYVNASTLSPVLLQITPSVDVALSGGSNSLIVGTTADDDFYYASGDVDPTSVGFGTVKKFVITVAGYLIAKLQSAAIAASKVLAISAITGANTQTVSIGGQVYTFNTSLTNTANNVLIGANAGAMGDNFAAAINAGAGAGTTYGTGTVANASASAVSDGTGNVTVTAKTPGTSGNSIVIAETLTNGAWAGGATALSGGANASTVGQTTLFLNA